MKPTSVTVPPGAMTAFQLGLVTVTRDPLWLAVPFHNWAMVCPPANRQRTVQPLSGLVPLLVMARLTWYWPVQELSTW